MGDIGAPYVFFAGVGIGNGRNDGTMRVYGGGYNAPSCERTWGGSNWASLNLSSSITCIWPLSVGEGRNDGMNRIYCPDGDSPRLYEYTCNGSFYEEEIINFSNPLTKVIVGDARGDSITHVDVGVRHSHVYELTWSGSGWNKLDISQYSGAVSRYGICIGETRADGHVRVYTTGQLGDIRERTWTGANWDDTQIDVTTGATSDLTIGRGKNDDAFRIYVTSSYPSGTNNNIYEFTNDTPYVKIKEPKYCLPTVLYQNFPNPVTSTTTIKFTLNKTGYVRLELCDISGKLIKELLDKKCGPGSHEVRWKAEVPSGVYFYQLKGGEFILSKKLTRF